jgi:hypothetical protein
MLFLSPMYMAQILREGWTQDDLSHIGLSP